MALWKESGREMCIRDSLSGYAINPLITLGAGSIGLTAGLLWRALPNLRLGLRTQISVFAGHAVGSICLLYTSRCV